MIFVVIIAFLYTRRICSYKISIMIHSATNNATNYSSKQGLPTPQIVFFSFDY